MVLLPGYVGYDEAGQLTEKVRRNPYSIILFDEIEKAHSNIYNILLQILDEGKLTDSQGKAVSFKHTVIVLTSNLGTNFKNDGYGFVSKEISSNMLVSKVDDSLKNFFTPEFLNRIDEIITFGKLDKTSINQITKIMIDEYLKQTAINGYSINITKKAIQYISDIGFDSKYGARPLKRAIQKHIEDLIAIKCLKEEIVPNKEYTIDVVNSVISIVDN